MKHKLFKIALSETHKYAQLMHTAADRLAYNDVSRAIRESAQFKGIRSPDVQTLAEQVVAHLRESVMSEIDQVIRDAKEDGLDDITIARELAEKYGMRLPDAQRFVAQWVADNLDENSSGATVYAGLEGDEAERLATSRARMRQFMAKTGADSDVAWDYLTKNHWNLSIAVGKYRQANSTTNEAQTMGGALRNELSKAESVTEATSALAQWKQKVKAAHPTATFEVRKKTDRYGSDRVEANVGDRMVGYFEKKSGRSNVLEAAEKSIKVYHVDRNGKEGYTVVDSAAALQDHIKGLKRSGAKITHTASMINGQEGPAVYPKAAQVDENFSGAIAEVGYADALGDLNIPHNELVASAQPDGTISQRSVMKFTQGDDCLYFFESDGEIDALVLLAGNNLKAIKNYTNEKGLVFALLNHIVSMKGTEVRVDATEPLTAEGFKWVAALIKNKAGLRVRDSAGQEVDISALEAEWKKSKAGHGEESGPTGLVITEASASWKKKLIENEQRIMPFAYFNVSAKRVVNESRYAGLKGSAVYSNTTESEQLDELSSATLKSYADKRMASFDRTKGIARGSEEHKQWKMAQKAYDQSAAKSQVPSQARESVESDIDQLIDFHQTGLANAQYKGPMAAMHRKKLRALMTKKQRSHRDQEAADWHELQRERSPLQKRAQYVEDGSIAIKPGDRVRTIRMGQTPGVVEKVEDGYVYFRHESGRLYRAPLSNVKLDEEMSRSQEQERERIVKGMKKNKADFADRYGKRGEEVMYATATKRAMGEDSDNAYQSGLRSAIEILRRANQEFQKTGDRSVLDRAHREYAQAYDKLVAAQPQAHSRQAARNQVWGPAGTND